MSLRLRLTLAFLAIVSLLLVVAVTSYINGQRTQRQVSALRSDMGLDLRRVELRSVSLEIEGFWNPEGSFVASKVEVAPGSRRPKLRGVIQKLDPERRWLQMFGQMIALDEVEFVDETGRALGLQGLAVGQRIEVTCKIDKGDWECDKLKTERVKKSDKIKATPTSSELDGVAPETLEIHGLTVSLPQSKETGAESALQRLKLSTKIALSIGECRAAAYELVGRSAPQEPDAEMDEVLAREDRGDQTASERIIAARDIIAQYVHLLQQTSGKNTAPTMTVARWTVSLLELQRTFQDHIEQILARTDDPPELQRYVDEWFSPFLEEELLPLVYAFRGKSEEQLEEQLKAVVASTTVTTSLATKTSIVAVGLAFLLGFLLWRSIHRPLRALQEAARLLGGGRLDTRVPVHSEDEVGVLSRAFNRMAAQLAATTVSMENLEAVFDSMGGALFVFDRDKRISNVNHAVLKLLGYERDELIGMAFCDICPDRELAPKNETAIGPAAVATSETSFSRKDGSSVPVSFTGSKLEMNDGEVVGYVCMALDLTYRKRMEEKLRHSLSEKELLLREVHHRVKNNMQVISSLLSMQSSQLEDRKTVERFEESQNRIRSMALIHEQLYQSDDFAEIDMSSYLQVLTDHVLQSQRPDGSVGIVLQLDELSFDVDQALACGLIINELVGNAFKHAFAGRSGGSIRISLRAGDKDHCTLEVADDGRGLERPFDEERTETLGLNLVTTLAEQLGGEVETNGRDGLCVTIRFRRRDHPNLLAS